MSRAGPGGGIGQTRGAQNAVAFGPCGFESHPGYLTSLVPRASRDAARRSPSAAAAAVSLRADVHGRAHPRMDHALEPDGPGREVAHGEGGPAREHGARVRERIERRAV